MSAEDCRWARWAFEHTERRAADLLGDLQSVNSPRSVNSSRSATSPRSAGSFQTTNSQRTIYSPRTKNSLRNRLRLEHAVANMLAVERRLAAADTGFQSPRADDGRPLDTQLRLFYEGMGAFCRTYVARVASLGRETATLVPCDTSALDTFGSDPSTTLFTAEERHGRCLDLVGHHRAWLDIVLRASAPTDTDYASYIASFDDVARPRAAAQAAGAHTEYAAYVRGLCAYLASFVRRAMPLADVPHGPVASPGDALYCAACDRRYASPNVFAHHLGGRRHLRASAPSPARSVTDAMTRSGFGDAHIGDSVAATNGCRVIDTHGIPVADNGSEVGDTVGGTVADIGRATDALPLPSAEALIVRYGTLLGDVRVATRAAVEARQTLTAGERAARTLSDTDSSNSASSGDEDTPDTNPLRLPLDFDGRPMPYWLWRLQGLGTRYTCEICGGHAYAGRRAFDAHFYEWRHAAAMRALGVPNTRHFFHVTAVEDARALWERMRRTARAEVLDVDAVEECEDRRGNVYTRRTYEDLVRQGLL